MGLVDTVRSLSWNIRAGWHGVALFGVGIGVEYVAVKLGVDDPHLVNALRFGIPLAKGLGILFVMGSWPSYDKAKNNMLKYGQLDEKSAHRYMGAYCNRQELRTAAYQLGHGDDFETFRDSFTGRQVFGWIPHL